MSEIKNGQRLVVYKEINQSIIETKFGDEANGCCCMYLCNTRNYNFSQSPKGVDGGRPSFSFVILLFYYKIMLIIT